MKLCFDRWVRVMLVGLVMVVGLIWSSPALAGSSANLLGPSIISTTTPPSGSAKNTTSNGSAKNLMGRDGNPLSIGINSNGPRGLDLGRLGQVANDINKSNAPSKTSIAQNKQGGKSGDRIQADLNSSSKLTQKDEKPDRLAVRVR